MKGGGWGEEWGWGGGAFCRTGHQRVVVGRGFTVRETGGGGGGGEGWLSFADSKLIDLIKEIRFCIT